MGCPADHRFNVAPILLDNTQKVLNLTVSISALYAFNESENTLSESENENYVISLLKLFVLTLCTSYKVEETKCIILLISSRFRDMIILNVRRDSLWL